MQNSFGKWLAAIAVAVMTVPVGAVEPAPQTTQRPVADIVLHQNGQMTGVVMHTDGRPAAQTRVELLHRKTVVAKAVTDQNGRYRFDGLRKGLHSVRTEHGQQACRLWESETAPPQAKQQLTLICDETVVRGQGGLFATSDSEILFGLAAFAGVSGVVWASTNRPTGAPTPPPASP